MVKTYHQDQIVAGQDLSLNYLKAALFWNEERSDA